MTDDTIFDPALVHRLSRPARRPGLVDLGQARSALTRHHVMTAGLPLAEIASRYVDVAARQHAGPAAPIVYARPVPPPPAEPTAAATGPRPAGPAVGVFPTGPGVGVSPTGPATATTGPASPVPTDAGPPAPAHPMPVAAARRASTASTVPAAASVAQTSGETVFDGTVSGVPSADAPGPVVPARPARPTAGLSPMWIAAGPGVAGRGARSVTSRAVVGRPSAVHRTAAASATSPDPGSGPPQAHPGGRPVPTGPSPSAGVPGAAAGPWAPGTAGRTAAGPHLTFRTPPTPDHTIGLAAGVPVAAGRRPAPTAPAQVVAARRPAPGPVSQLPLAAPSVTAAQVRTASGTAGVSSAPGLSPYPTVAGPARAAASGPGYAAAGPGGRGFGGRGFGVRGFGGQPPGGPRSDPPTADRAGPQPQPGPAARVDVGHVTDQVHDRIMRRLAVEAERRGVRR
ncbi:hypothetical protein ACN27F_28620 [Solwaraspora sp. WMMB335]|uniref:hypothetical protein n=1 Tax=Solwaraspora sp. WMMB335 TaxID=3404118 RepID=UPI003B95AF52